MDRTILSLLPLVVLLQAQGFAQLKHGASGAGHPLIIPEPVLGNAGKGAGKNF